jgi:hypothetical protein
MSTCARFKLTQHDHYTGEAGQFKLLWVEHLAANNLPVQVSQLLCNCKKPKSACPPCLAK